MKKIKDVDQKSQGDMVPDLREFARSTIEQRIRAQVLAYVAEIMKEEVNALCGSPYQRKNRDGLSVSPWRIRFRFHNDFWQSNQNPEAPSKRKWKRGPLKNIRISIRFFKSWRLHLQDDAFRHIHPIL